jgi:hypothetical protein
MLAETGPYEVALYFWNLGWSLLDVFGRLFIITLGILLFFGKVELVWKRKTVKNEGDQ